MAGAALATSGGPAGPLPVLRLLVAALAGMALYAGGVALNDLVDREVDRRRHPRRPLPSGRLGSRAALAIATGAILAGLGLAAIASAAVLAVALVTTAGILGYDLGLRRAAVPGGLALGLARGSNLAMGMAVVLPAGMDGVRSLPAAPLIFPLLYFLLIACLTLVSTFEEKPVGRAFRPAILGVGSGLLSPALGGHAPWLMLAGSLVLACVMLAPGFARPPRPAEVVRRVVFGLGGHHALLAAGAGRPDLALAALVLAALVLVTRRALGATDA